MQYVHSMQDRRHLLNSENLHIFRMFAGHKNPNKCTQSIFFLVTPYAAFKLVNDAIGFNGKKLLSSLPFSCESKNYRFTSLKTYRISNMPNANPNACHRCRCCFFFASSVCHWIPSSMKLISFYIFIHFIHTALFIHSCMYMCVLILVMHHATRQIAIWFFFSTLNDRDCFILNKLHAKCILFTCKKETIETIAMQTNYDLYVHVQLHES